MRQEGLSGGDKWCYLLDGERLAPLGKIADSGRQNFSPVHSFILRGVGAQFGSPFCSTVFAEHFLGSIPVGGDSATFFTVELRHRALQVQRHGMRALAPFYDLTSARLFRYALTITRNRHDAEDVLQQVIVQLALHPQGVAEALQPWAYCLTVLRN